jgi:hypothetical protein
VTVLRPGLLGALENDGGAGGGGTVKAARDELLTSDAPGELLVTS